MEMSNQELKELIQDRLPFLKPEEVYYVVDLVADLLEKHYPHDTLDNSTPVEIQ